jgi:transposase-like protein/IS1 family transposase
VNCATCQNLAVKFGKTGNGSQRYLCRECNYTFVDARQADGRQLDEAKKIYCLRNLLEGASVRSTERMTGVHRDTILAAMVDAGQKCQAWMERNLRGLTVNDVQADEVWAFVAMKERTRQRLNRPECFGDCFTFTALERTSKVIVAWHVGKRCPEDTREFALKLHRATQGRFQLTTDGYRPYLTAIPNEFGHSIDYATLVKVYGESEDERRYSPPTVIDTIATARLGNPAESRICTSHVERSNKTFRMGNRRFTRLTDAHSKKWQNHEAMLGLFIAYYNYCRSHKTLTERNERKTTPMMEAGLTDHVWTVQELLAAANRSE